MVGKPIDIAHENSVEFNSATLSFEISENILQTHSIEDLRIAYYDINNNSLEILDTIYYGNKISTETNHFSHYMVVDNNRYLNDIYYKNESDIIDNDINDGTWVRLNSGKLVKLDKDPNLGDYSVDTDKDGIKDGLDISPTYYDIRIVNRTETTIEFNNGKVWNIFGKDIYKLHRDFNSILVATPIHNPDFGNDMNILYENSKLKFNKTELAMLAMLDINGVRHYLTGKKKSLREDVFEILTGRASKYYKHTWLAGWEEISPRDEEWHDFITRDIKSEADASLTVYYGSDLNTVIKGVVFIGVVVGASYLVAVESTLLAEVCSVYGVYNGLTMYTNGGSGFIQMILDDFYSDGDCDMLGTAQVAIEGWIEVKIVYIGEWSTVSPEVVFQNGFTPKGTHNDALLHTKSNTTAGDFISTTDKFEVARDGFAGKNGYVYVIETNNYDNSVDINATFGDKVYFPE